MIVREMVHKLFVWTAGWIGSVLHSRREMK